MYYFNIVGMLSEGAVMEGKTILVIEDNEMNMKLMQAILQSANYAMLEAPDAETGIRLAKEHHPDLILMDIQLPGMDGWTAMKIIKADADLCHIPAFAVSGFATGSDQKKAMDIGFSGYITKPFSVRSLLKTLDQHFSPHQAQDIPGE
jgi:two-component system, cell cycle response regulator DivK